jgi:hypothetical protein
MYEEGKWALWVYIDLRQVEDVSKCPHWLFPFIFYLLSLVF